jgi:uncharacterized membrane protein (UPF0127 family)
MRRFRFAPVVRLSVQGSLGLDAWVARGPLSRLLGLAGLPGLPPGSGLLIPRCASVHTVAMRFAMDVAFVSWPPVSGGCEVLSTHDAVPGLRIVGVGLRATRSTAALEAPAGVLAALGARAGGRVTVSGPPSAGVTFRA